PVPVDWGWLRGSGGVGWLSCACKFDIFLRAYSLGSAHADTLDRPGFTHITVRSLLRDFAPTRFTPTKQGTQSRLSYPSRSRRFDFAQFFTLRASSTSSGLSIFRILSPPSGAHSRITVRGFCVVTLPKTLVGN